MEGESLVRYGKRKAGLSSPVREIENHENQSGSIGMIGNDRKRRDTGSYGSSHPPLADADGLDDGNGTGTSQNSHDEDDDEGDNDEGDDDEGDDDEGDDDDEDNDDDDDDDETESLEISVGDSEDELHNSGEYFDEDDDMGPPELEVEEQEHSLGESVDGQVTLKLYLQEDDDEFERWMQTIHVRCSYDGKEIGRGFGRYVNRDCIRPNFWRDMEEPCQELSTVAFEVFDRYGRLKQEFMDHTVRKGTGCWGSELNFGSLFIIEYMQVTKAWRRKGVGKIMTTSLIRKACAGRRQPAFTLAIPAWLTSDIRDDTDGKTNLEQQEIRLRALDAATSFYRSLGFRRIGASGCFGLATDPNHKAHQIPPVADFDPFQEEAEEDVPEDGDEVETPFEILFGDPAKSSRRLKLLQDRLPLHHATITLSDSECVDFYKEFKKSENSGEDWVKVDRFRKNVLHLAACELKIKSVQWLLENADEGQVLSSAMNSEGYTPLEGLEYHLESKRTTLEHGTMTICISDRFCGFPSEAIVCLAALYGNETFTRIQLLRLKYGCTCGECVNGFLSPRMKFALLCQAEIGHDMLSEEIEDGEHWCLLHEDTIIHVAPDIQRNFLTNKSLRTGFGKIFLHTTDALRANIAPTIDNVLDVWRDSSEWPPVTMSFYQRGGTTESALRIIFEHAREQDEWAGDGHHMAVFEREISALPQCRNDHEFEFVALACGVPNL